jgi:hypothetical protein
VSEKLSLFEEEEHNLQMFENKVLGDVSRHKKNELNNLRYYTTKNFVICVGHIILFGF